MNRFKFCRVLAGVLAVFFVSLLAAEGFEDSTKFYLNMFAILCTTLTAFSSNILTDFGWENRFKQNMRSLGELRTLETKYKMEKSLLEEPTEIDYRHWNSNIDKVLGGQAATFEEEFQRAVQSK